MATEFLQIPDIAASQNQKEVTANAAHNLLDRAINKNVAKAITVDTSFTTTETRENGFIEFTGTPGVPHNINMSDTNKRNLTVFNNTDAIMTIRNSAGAGLNQQVLGVGKTKEFFYDGVDFFNGSGGSTLSVEDEGAEQEADTTVMNFVGGGVVVTNPGTGEVTVTVDGGPDASGFLTRNELFHVRDEKSSGTGGGTPSAGVQNTRVLNTTVTNEIPNASLASNQISLPVGEYYIEASAPAFLTDQHKLRLRDITNVLTLVVGTSQFANDAAGPNHSTDSFLSGRFSLSGTTTIELQHFMTAAAADGLGVATSSGEVEVYAEVRIWRDPGVAFKPPVRVATVSNGTLATAFENGDTIDGVTLATDDRILLKDQSTVAENGIYVVNVTGAPTRAADMDDDADLGLGVTIAVLLGDVNARTIWMHTTGTTIAGSKTFEKTEPVVGYMPLSLGSLRDIATNDIAGPLDSTTTPLFERINLATDKGLRVTWVATNVDEVAWPEVYMPPDLDSDKDITIHIVGEMSGVTDTPTIDVQVFDSSGDTEMGGATAAFTDTRAEKTVTIIAADITGHPLGWLSISLVPAAHGTDNLRIFSAWIEYTRKTT